MAPERPEGTSVSALFAYAFGTPITKMIGILGVAWTIFENLERFLKFSRGIADLVERCRELTRGVWGWLAKLVDIDPPEFVADVANLLLFLFLFTISAILPSGGSANTSNHDKTLQDEQRPERQSPDLDELIRKSQWKVDMLFPRGRIKRLIEYVSMLMALPLIAPLTLSIVPAAVILTLYPYVGWFFGLFGGVIISAAYLVAWFELGMRDWGLRMAYNSFYATLILAMLLGIYSVARHSDAIQAWYLGL